METHEIAERLGVPSRSFGWRFTAINPALDVQRPFLGVAAAEKRLVDISSFTPNLSAPGPRF
jgi:hypothetical protein